MAAAAFLVSAPPAGAAPPDPQDTVTIRVSSELGSGYECLGAYGTTAGTVIRTANCTTFNDRWDIVRAPGVEDYFVRWSGNEHVPHDPVVEELRGDPLPLRGHADQRWDQRELRSDQRGYLTEFTPAFDTSRRSTSPPWSTVSMSYPDTPYADQEFWVDWY